MTWELLPDPDRLDRFWFYDASSTVIASVVVRGRLWKIWIENNHGLTLNAWDEPIYNRQAVRQARVRDLHDSDIQAYRRAGLIREEGQLYVSCDHLNYDVNGTSVTDAINKIFEEV